MAGPLAAVASRRQSTPMRRLAPPAATVCAAVQVVVPGATRAKSAAGIEMPGDLATMVITAPTAEAS